MYTKKWDLRYLKLAREVSSWSKDPNKQCGAVIVENNKIRGIGFNGFPYGVEDSEDRLQDKPFKLSLIVHAEVNAIIAAECKGDCIYIWPQLPCGQCLGHIIQAGIKRIVTGALNPDSAWPQDLVLSIAHEAGLDVLMYQ